MSVTDWDDAFENMGHIANSKELPDFWSNRAARYRADAIQQKQRLDTDIQYGEHTREVFDMVWPDSSVKGLIVFVHGGYWIRLDKSYWTDLAEGARANGWAVCIPSYTLAPEARIGDITKQITRAISKASELVPGPIRLVGHSAGGHLVSRMLCGDTELLGEILSRVEHTVSISGLHDLRPLMHTKMNASLQLDLSEATTESAALHKPMIGTSITTWVGGGERPEFIRQSKLLSLMWEGLDATTNCTIDEQHNHFTVIEGLKDANSAITAELLKVIN